MTESYFTAFSAVPDYIPLWQEYGSALSTYCKIAALMAGNHWEDISSSPLLIEKIFIAVKELTLALNQQSDHSSPFYLMLKHALSFMV